MVSTLADLLKETWVTFGLGGIAALGICAIGFALLPNRLRKMLIEFGKGLIKSSLKKR